MCRLYACTVVYYRHGLRFGFDRNILGADPIYMSNLFIKSKISQL